MTARVRAKIVGQSALLMHSFPMVTPDPPLEKRTPEEQAEFATYRNSDGKLYVPGVAFQRALVNGATFLKGKGRATLQKPVAACVIVDQEHLVLDQQEYVLDSRPVVVPATKGRVVRHRPKFPVWSFEVEIEYDPSLVTEPELRRVVDETGSRVGLLDFRPEKKGPFGRFRVDEWTILTA